MLKLQKLKNNLSADERDVLEERYRQRHQRPPVVTLAPEQINPNLMNLENQALQRNPSKPK